MAPSIGALYENYIAQVADGGARAVAMNMAASEGGSLTPDEQAEVIRRTKSVLAGACPVISGVLSGYTMGAIAAAKRMVDAGADGLVVFPSLPTFIPSRSRSTCWSISMPISPIRWMYR